MKILTAIRSSSFPELWTFLLILCLVFSLSAEAKVWTIPIKNDLFSSLRDFEQLKPNDNFEFALNTETKEIDISDFVDILNRVKKSQYNNFALIDVRIKPKIYGNHIFSLCKKLENLEDSLSCEKETQKKINKVITQLGNELLQDVRYPYNYYRMDTSEGNEALSKARRTLTSKCPDCQTIHLNKGSQSEFNQLFPVIEQLNPSCLKSIAKSMVEQLNRYRLPDSCHTNKTHSVCQNILQDWRLLQDRLFRLAELIYGRSARSETEMQFCSTCSRLSEQNDSKEIDFKSLQNTWQQASNCEDLQHGEKKRVSSGTSLPKKYIIRREQNGSYSVVLNLQFIAAKDYPFKDKDKVPSRYRSEVQKCLKKANAKMLCDHHQPFL